MAKCRKCGHEVHFAHRWIAGICPSCIHNAGRSVAGRAWIEELKQKGEEAEAKKAPKPQKILLEVSRVFLSCPCGGEFTEVLTEKHPITVLCPYCKVVEFYVAETRNLTIKFKLKKD